VSTALNQRPIAIVDDDESLQAALRDLIESAGLSTACFSSAQQFLDSGARHYAACLITDMRMPGMSGLDIQSKLLAEGCQIPIIFMTAYGDTEMRNLAMSKGAAGFLSKPFSDTALLDIICITLQLPEDD
jgi:FixJ family two-component response regulator